MDGYTLASQLRKARRRYRLSATSQALYYELVAIANEEGWPDTFRCSNAELCNTLSITEKTLLLARLELIECELIQYSSGQCKRQFSEYRFQTTGKFPVKAPVNPPAKAPDHIKLIKKTETKILEEEVTAVPAVPDFDEAYNFFISTKNHRLLKEKFGLADAGLHNYFKTFFDSKIDLGDLDNKTLSEVARNFYYWLPLHLSAQNKALAIGQKTNNYSPSTNPAPVRGVAAALKFTGVKMRGEPEP